VGIDVRQPGLLEAAAGQARQFAGLLFRGAPEGAGDPLRARQAAEDVESLAVVAGILAVDDGVVGLVVVREQALVAAGLAEWLACSVDFLGEACPVPVRWPGAGSA
jgi:hypothetical protein